MYFLEIIDNCGGLGSIISLIKEILSIVFILLGVVLVVLIIIDIAKAIIASEEKEVKGYQKAAIRRVIYFAIIFFVVTLVNLIFGVLSRHTETTISGNEKDPTWYECWDDPQCEKTGACADGRKPSKG